MPNLGITTNPVTWLSFDFTTPGHVYRTTFNFNLGVSLTGRRKYQRRAVPEEELSLSAKATRDKIFRRHHPSPRLHPSLPPSLMLPPSRKATTDKMVDRKTTGDESGGKRLRGTSTTDLSVKACPP